MEYEEIKQPLGMIAFGAFFILASILLVFDPEIVNFNNMDLFFFMTVVLGILLAIAGILLIIVGIVRIKDVNNK